MSGLSHNPALRALVIAPSQSRQLGHSTSIMESGSLHGRPSVVRLRVATLGPAETDAATLAARISERVHLVDSFRDAMAFACADDTAAALVPCGYVARTPLGLLETWTDLHFEFSDRLQIVACWNEPTRPMCLAANTHGTTHGTLVSHAATRWFAERFAPGMELHYASNKPDAARLCAEGQFDMCIASADVVRRHAALRIVQTFDAEMVWVLYLRRNPESALP